MKKILLFIGLFVFLSQGYTQENYIDLGLLSGTLWNKNNESGLIKFDYIYGELPSKRQWEELINSCKWVSTPNGYRVTGPNGNSIFFPANGYVDCNNDDAYSDGYKGGYITGAGDLGYYWSRSTYTSDNYWKDALGRHHYRTYAYILYFNLDGDKPEISTEQTCSELSVRLVKTGE